MAAPIGPTAQLLSQMPCDAAVDAVREAFEMQPLFKDGVLQMVQPYLADMLSCVETDEGTKVEPDSIFEKQSLSITQSESLEEAFSDARRRTLLVAYFPRTATEHDLVQALGKVGTTSRARVVRHDGGASQCYGSVEFIDENSADAALNACRRGEVRLDDLTGLTRPWHTA